MAESKNRRRMSVKDVQALVTAERSDSLSSFQSSSLQDQRTTALDYYLGDMRKDLPTLPDRSTAVSTDVRDTIEGLMPSLMEIFASGDEVVRFEPVGIEDEEPAAQESQYVNHKFLHENPGWLILYTFIKDALQSKVGVVKVWWGQETEEDRETYTNIGEDELVSILQDETLELLSIDTEEVDEPVPAAVALASSDDGADTEGEAFAAASPSVTHSITVRKKKEYGCLKIECVPPEEFGISRDAKSIKDATYCYHETKRSRTELIREGYNKTQIEGLSPYGHPESDEEVIARDTVDETEFPVNNSSNKAAERIRVTEHYVRMDYEHSGEALLYRVTTAGESHEVLKREDGPAIDLVDCAPFATQTPVPITHRFYGLSVADLVLDIQRIKTSLIRAQMDNIYLLNNQRIEVAEEGATRNTIDDILDNKPGGIIRTKRVGSIAPVPNQPIGDMIMPAISYWDATREWRTGVTRQGQGIDADSLQNQTAEAVSKVFTAAQARMRLIARIFAETGMRDLFSLIHQTLRKNDTLGDTVRLRNNWVPIDPTKWGRRKDMTISVGLGSGSKDQQIQFLFALLGLQKEAIANPGVGLVQPQNLFNTLKKIVELGGLRSADPYFVDPQNKPYESPPDPDVEKAKVEMQIKQQEAQQDAQLGQAKLQQELQLKREQMAMEFQLKREQMLMEMQLKREQVGIEANLAHEENVMQAQNDREANISPTKMGGKVG